MSVDAQCARMLSMLCAMLLQMNTSPSKMIFSCHNKGSTFFHFLVNIRIELLDPQPILGIFLGAVLVRLLVDRALLILGLWEEVVFVQIGWVELVPIQWSLCMICTAV